MEARGGRPWPWLHLVHLPGTFYMMGTSGPGEQVGSVLVAPCQGGQRVLLSSHEGALCSCWVGSDGEGFSTGDR